MNAVMISRTGSFMLMAALLVAGCATMDSHRAAFDPLPGDLLFQDLDAGPLCVAIETVTLGTHGSDFSHVGMVSRNENGQTYVIEAVGAGVVETPLPKFLARSRDADGRPKVVVGRLNPPFDTLIPDAIAAAQQRLGLPYDAVYSMEQDAFYCSELLYTAFKEANGGAAVFTLYPMTFIDPATGAFFPAWTTYYESLGVPIPEGEPGLNPGGMSRSPALQIIHAYGRPTGWYGPMPQGVTTRP